jgi:hypothetical protein
MKMENGRCGGGVEQTDSGLTIHWYYPWGSKHIPYATIKSFKVVEISALTGKWRLWGTTNPHYWANLDVRRPSKALGIILDTGARVDPFITPDDAEAFAAELKRRCGIDPDVTPQKRPLI